MSNLWKRVLIVAAVLVGIFLVRVLFVVVSARAQNARATEADKTRDARYRPILARYESDIPLGLTRGDVEARIRAHGAAPAKVFNSASGKAYAEWVDIGNDPPPWDCSEWPVYISFEFLASNSDPMPSSDVLTLITLASRGDGCL
jgi:hypothetical protein